MFSLEEISFELFRTRSESQGDEGCRGPNKLLSKCLLISYNSCAVFTYNFLHMC